MKEPKYKVGDKVWVLCGHFVEEKAVTGVLALFREAQPELPSHFEYCLGAEENARLCRWHTDKLFFDSKEALLESL